MDPCPSIRILVGSLAIKFPTTSKPAGLHPSSPSFYCKIKLKNFPTQFSTIPISLQQTHQIHACFNLNKSEFDKIVENQSFKNSSRLKIEIYTGRVRGKIPWACGLISGKFLGSVSVPLDLNGVENRGCVIQNGWVGIGGRDKGSDSEAGQLYLNVRGEADPRFVFEFDGEPECSPQVFQVNGNVRQAVFTCKFSFRNSGDQNLRSRSLSESRALNSWQSSFRKDKQPSLKERKGWSITIHDLSGSPVAAASMVTPFVPSPGTNRVSQSNPGAWLILRPGQGTWKPWGRLEAWRELCSRGGCRSDNLGYRFKLLPDAATGGGDTVTLANSTISTKNGGKFTIDISIGTSPMTSANSSLDFSFGSVSGSEFELGSESWAHRGFVMSSTVGGGWRCSKPEVEVGVQHVTCMEDAAAFVALSAAMDLSMDACKLFSQKLRKELRQQGED